MWTRRHLLATTGAAVTAGCGGLAGSGDDAEADRGGATPGTPAATVANAGSGAGADGESTGDGTATPAGPLEFTSDAFADGGTVPERYTGVDEDASPPLNVNVVPDAAESLAIAVEDVDADMFVHWTLWNVPADASRVPEGIPQEETVPALDGARQGTNDFGELGYRGPYPPPADGPHTYRFLLFAADRSLDLAAGASRDELTDALDGHVVGVDRVTAEFDR